MLLASGPGTVFAGNGAAKATSLSGELVSEFFRNDPTAIAIAAGLTTRDINDFNLRTGEAPGDVRTFAFRVLSGYRQLGYSFPFQQWIGTRPQEIVQKSFQKSEGLPVTSTIDRDLLLRLDGLLFSKEAADAPLAARFPLISNMFDAPLNEPPRTHLAAIYSLVFGKLPADLAPWTPTNFESAFHTQGPPEILQFGTPGFGVCDPFYYESLGFECKPHDPYLSVWNDDFSEANTLLHEYAHFLDGMIYPNIERTSSGTVSTLPFYDISFDTADEIFHGWHFYRPRSSTVEDYVSGYAKEAWTDATIPGYRTAQEDFAESFVAYVLRGWIFRDLARSNAVLARKYDWLKQNVFGGAEYETGNRNYAAFLGAGSDSRPWNVIDYGRKDPAFVWEYRVTGGPSWAVLPTSAHMAGVGGALYTTSVSVSNVGVSSASLTLKFLGNNQDGSGEPGRTFDLEPGSSTTFFDVLGSVFSRTSSFGAIRVTSNSSALDIVSMTSTPGFGGTFGQTIPAVSSSNLIPAASPRSILYIREGDGFRSNLVLASGAPLATDVHVALFSPAGEILATKSFAVPPNGMTQVNRVVRDMGVSGAITGGRLVLSSPTPGAAFAGLASVIDEATNDPTTVVAQPTSVSGWAPFRWLLPASAHSRGVNGAFYTTTVTVANVGAAPASFTMKFLGNNQNGSSGPEQTFDLGSGESVTTFDVLGSVFNQASAFGAIRITSASPSVNIVSVTSTPGFGGIFGQTIPAVSSFDLISTGTARSILGIREGDGFRTNLILASDADVYTAVDVALVTPEGTTLGAKSYSVPPNGMTQVNHIVRDMGVSGAITGARLMLFSSTPGAAFTGFASVIDEVTNDPTTVEAR